MRESLLSDELLRHLMAAGQVDLLVGLPTLNNAATVGPVVAAVHSAFNRQFARERTVLLSLDGGSTDGTPDAVRAATRTESDMLMASEPLRTVHRITAPYHGVPGKWRAVQILFVAADLLQARAVVVLDPGVTTATPEWVARLARPIASGEGEFVAPVYARRAFDGPLVTQIVRPVVRACYGHRINEPLAGEFGCSGRFATHCLEQDVWDREIAQFGLDLWLVSTALASGFRTVHAWLGRHERVAPPGVALPQLIRQVVGSLFGCLELHDQYWLPRTGSEPVAVAGDPPEPPDWAAPPDPRPLADAFRTGVHDLAPILERVLPGELNASLQRLSQQSAPAMFPDEVWVETVYEFALAHHRGVMRGEHLLQALVPLYLGRIASVFESHLNGAAGSVDEALDRLGEAYEEAKPALVERWTMQEET